MRIGVTGAAGFIGSHVCERLLADGHEVLGVDAFTRFYARGLKEANLAGLRRAPGFELAELNLLGTAALSGTLAGLDAVCHLAGRPGRAPRLPRDLRGRQRAHHRGRARRRRAAGVRRVVLASSSSVYGRAAGRVSEHAPLRPLSHYGRSKLPGRARGPAPGAGARDRAGGPSLLHGLRAAPAARHGLRPVRRPRRSSGGRCRCWATAARCGTSPTSATRRRPPRSR